MTDFTEAHEMALTSELDPPRIIGSTVLQMSFIPKNKKQMPVGLGHELPMDKVAELALKMRKGQVRFQVRRMTGEEVDIVLSPAELMMLIDMSDRFVTELPR